MKKLIALLLAMIMMLTFAACGDKTPAGDADESKPGQNEETNLGENQKDESDEKALTVDAVKAAPETPAEEFSYRETEDGIVIYGYEGDGGVVVIPQKIDGLDVVEIEHKAFVNNATVTAVRLPDTVQYVGSHVFENCSGMKVFVSGASVKELGEFAFNHCTSLEAVELNEGLEVIAPCCFEGMPLREFEIPSTVTELESAFAGDEDSPIVLISEAGGYVEQFVAGLSEDWCIEFRAK